MHSLINYSKITLFKKQLDSTFRIKDLGDLIFLGFQIVYNVWYKHILTQICSLISFLELGYSLISTPFFIMKLIYI